MKKQQIVLTLSYRELEALTELALCGENIINYVPAGYVPAGKKKKPVKIYADLKKRIAGEWRARTLKYEPETAEDIEEEIDYVNYLSDWANQHIIAYDNANFPELLACKLQFIKGGTPQIRDAIARSGIFDEENE